MTRLAIIFSLLFVTPALVGCVGGSFSEEFVQADNQQYVAITETAYYRGAKGKF